jgi:hypothetical protein
MSRFCALPPAVRAGPRAWLGGLRWRGLRRRSGGGQDEQRGVLKGRPRGRRGPPLASARGSQTARKRARSVDVIHMRRGALRPRHWRRGHQVRSPARRRRAAGRNRRRVVSGYKRPCRRPAPRGWRSAPDPRPAPGGGPSGCGNRSSHLPFAGLRREASMITFTCLLCPPPVDLPLVVLPGLPEHAQPYDRPFSSTPVPETASGHTSLADRLRRSRAAKPTTGHLHCAAADTSAVLRA